MSFIAEGTVEIDLCDLHEWILSGGHLPVGPDYAWGPPRVNKSNQTLEIDFAMDNFGNNPATWAEKPNALKQWKDLDQAMRPTTTQENNND